MNIVEPIFAQARYQPDAIALCVPGEHHSIITYAQVAQVIRNIALKALLSGLKPSDTVVTFVEDGIMHALLILGLAHAGVVTISGRNPRLPEEIKIDAILSDPGRTFQAGARVINVDQSWTFGDAASQSTRPVTHGDQLARIIFTSGTTGDAKGVAYTHRMVMERAVRFDYLAGNMLGSSLRVYLDLGFATSLGYLWLIRTLSRGGLLVLPGAAYEHVLNACDLYAVDSWIGAPGGVLNLVDYLDQSGGRRCNFRAVLAGGSLLSKALSQRARARACTNLVTAYGSTETNMVATGHAFITAQTDGAVGFLTPGMNVEIAGENGDALPPGGEGLIRIKGPYNVKEYVGDAASSAEAFRNGWFYSGDIGTLTRDDLLVITGRQKTVMNIGGDKIKPELVEEVLTAYAGVDDAGVLSFVNDYGLEEIWAVYASQSNVAELDLFNHCKSRLPPSFVPRKFIRTAKVPRNQMGKIDRPGLNELAKPTAAKP